MSEIFSSHVIFLSATAMNYDKSLQQRIFSSTWARAVCLIASASFVIIPETHSCDESPRRNFSVEFPATNLQRQSQYPATRWILLVVRLHTRRFLITIALFVLFLVCFVCFRCVHHLLYYQLQRQISWTWMDVLKEERTDKWMDKRANEWDK